MVLFSCKASNLIVYHWVVYSEKEDDEASLDTEKLLLYLILRSNSIFVHSLFLTQCFCGCLQPNWNPPRRKIGWEMPPPTVKSQIVYYHKHSNSFFPISPRPIYEKWGKCQTRCLWKLFKPVIDSVMKSFVLFFLYQKCFWIDKKKLYQRRRFYFTRKGNFYIDYGCQNRRMFAYTLNV